MPATGLLTRIIACLLIIIGLAIIGYVLPQALSLLNLTAESPFLGELFSWLMSDSDSMIEKISEEFFEVIQAFLKVIVVVVFMYMCVKLVTIGLLILREGVSLLRGESKAAKPAKKSEQPAE